MLCEWICWECFVGLCWPFSHAWWPHAVSKIPPHDTLQTKFGWENSIDTFVFKDTIIEFIEFRSFRCGPIITADRSQCLCSAVTLYWSWSWIIHSLLQKHSKPTQENPNSRGLHDMVTHTESRVPLDLCLTHMLVCVLGMLWLWTHFKRKQVQSPPSLHQIFSDNIWHFTLAQKTAPTCRFTWQITLHVIK